MMKDKSGEHPFGDAGQLILLVVFLFLWVMDSFLLQASTFASQYVPFFIRFVILCSSLITAIFLFRTGHVVLNPEEPPIGVLSSGVFRYVRHPLYLACILFYFGLTVFTASLLSLFVLVIIIVFYNFIASYEEKLLEARFKEEYTHYKRRTGKWLPIICRKDKGDARAQKCDHREL